MTFDEAVRVLRKHADGAYPLDGYVEVMCAPDNEEEVCNRLALAIETISQSRECLEKCGYDWVTNTGHKHAPGCPNERKEETP